MNGKGDYPRNLGPKFRENYEAINWQRKPQPAAQQQAQAAADVAPAMPDATLGSVRQSGQKLEVG